MASKGFSWGSVTWDGDINVSEAPASKSADMKDQPGYFTCIRVVANLKLTRTTPGALNPPARLQVKITSSDLQAAGNDINKIKVAYWRGGWTVLPVESRGSGLVTVVYDKNGDPPIGVGQ